MKKETKTKQEKQNWKGAHNPLSPSPPPPCPSLATLLTPPHSPQSVSWIRLNACCQRFFIIFSMGRPAAVSVLMSLLPAGVLVLAAGPGAWRGPPNQKWSPPFFAEAPAHKSASRYRSRNPIPPANRGIPSLESKANARTFHRFLTSPQQHDFRTSFMASFCPRLLSGYCLSAFRASFSCSRPWCVCKGAPGLTRIYPRFVSI